MRAESVPRAPIGGRVLSEKDARRWRWPRVRGRPLLVPASGQGRPCGAAEQGPHCCSRSGRGRVAAESSCSLHLFIARAACFIYLVFLASASQDPVCFVLPEGTRLPGLGCCHCRGPHLSGDNRKPSMHTRTHSHTPMHTQPHTEACTHVCTQPHTLGHAHTLKHPHTGACTHSRMHTHTH